MEFLLQSLTGMRWQDYVDICLNSYILFRLYVLFRGTNVIRMVIAIGMLWLFQRMAMGMELIVTSWAMQAIIAAAALIIVIVFRNEIAGVLQTRDLKSFFWGIHRHRIDTPIDIIVTSVSELTRHRLGALIVLPLKKDLGSVVHGGISWEGKLSREMLLSIFWDGSPAHDGATIIRGDRVAKVAAILPLSKRKDLPSEFGTRHRAAAGLAERTDALILVVSEERGEVTLFKDETITTIRDHRELDRLLRESLGAIPADGNAVWKKTLEFSSAAVICLLCVTGIWLNFARGFETLASLEVPVEFTDRAAGMEIISASPSSVKLQISGSGPLIKSIRPDQVKIQLSLANGVAGINEIAISGDNVILPPGVQLKQVEPENLEVTLDVPHSKTLSVQPDWSGKLPEGLVLKEAYTIPDRVKVSGGGHALNGIETIYTEKIPLENLDAGGTLSTRLVLQPSSLKLEQSPAQVELVYTLGKRVTAPGEEFR